jgi:hypothetical protein
MKARAAIAVAVRTIGTTFIGRVAGRPRLKPSIQ